MAAKGDILTAQQLALHGLEKTDLGMKYRDDIDVMSYFQPLSEVIRRYYPISEKLNPISATERELIVIADRQYSHLQSIHIKCVTPALAVKEEYRDRVKICWTRNLASNVTPAIEMRWGNDSIDET